MNTDARYELRDHLNADHGYTIPLGQTLSDIAWNALRREHDAKHTADSITDAKFNRSTGNSSLHA